MRKKMKRKETKEEKKMTFINRNREWEVVVIAEVSGCKQQEMSSLGLADPMSSPECW